MKTGILLQTPMGFFTLTEVEVSIWDDLVAAGEEQPMAEYLLALTRERNRVAVRVWRVLLGLEAR